ncbi:MAG: hypothetical protein IJB95_06140, partial [Clostridia bacterium]|nr:hypothetical protein [Clostridia bacterium]
MIVALTAVGFAAWLIVGTIDAETQGSFVSNELEDKYFKVEVEFNTVADEKNGQIIFGRPAGASKDGDWLTYSSNDEEEKLSATATIKFIPDAGFEDHDMEYYLLESSVEGSDGKTTNTYRTIRVMLDINEVITSSSETDNYKWFDWAVQLGYLQYPTAEWVDPATSTSQNKPLSWLKTVVTGEGEDQTISYVALDENETPAFENCFLYIDLTYDMFEVDDGKEFATADIEITFDWGKAVSETTVVDGQSETTYYNPYEFFNFKDAEKAVEISNYFANETSGVLGEEHMDLPDRAGERICRGERLPGGHNARHRSGVHHEVRCLA